MKHILLAMDEHPPNCYCCADISTRLQWSIALKQIKRTCQSYLPCSLTTSSSGSTPSSKARNRYTPNSNNAPAAPAPQTQTSNAGATTSATIHAHSTIHAPGRAAGAAPPVDTFCIMFGVKDMQGFHDIDHLDIDAQLLDSTFFEKLKDCHKNHRWCFQNWFSPYVFRYCRFVQVGKSFDDIFTHI